MNIFHLIQYGLKMHKIIYKIKKIYYLIRYGKITSMTVDDINYTPCEIKYMDKNGNIIGYWAYGYFEPNLPYQGQTYFTFKPYYD